MYGQNLPEQYHRELEITRDYYMTHEEKPDEKIDYDKMTENQKFDLFKSELRRFGITNTWKWKDTDRVIKDSAHYSVLPTIKQKKQAFHEYVRDFIDKMNENKRENRKKQIEEFYEMLDSIHDIKATSKFYDILKYIQSDRRYIQLDEKDREETFQKYMDELEEKELKRKADHAKGKVESLKKLFASHEIPTTMKFAEAEEKFKENALFSAVDKLIQIQAFSDYITDRIEEEERIYDMKKLRESRKNREAFRELMDELVKDKKIKHNTQWKDIALLIKDDKRYHNVLLQSGSKPSDIFYDYIDIEKEKFNEHKTKFKNLLKTKSVRLGADISQEDFHKNLSEHTEYLEFPEDIRNLLYDYYINKVKPKSQRSKDSSKKRSKKHKRRHRRSRSRDRDRKRQEVEDGEYVS
ncbi:unnamed protein product [Moneuplotes crassus]|uniref:FF domain-containing protein n=1 Tax=Euplotes crassus TaxID=5936 RepID=A0AAD1XEB8_EUPCR|nr:unnamed protein product [Moneuplotes crassus]